MLRVGGRLGVGFVGRRQVTRQIHAVVKQSEHFDDQSVRGWGNPEDDEVSSLAPVAGDVQGMDVRADVLTEPRSDHIGALCQILQCAVQGLGIGSGLGPPEILDGPAQDGLVVLSGRIGNPCQMFD